jgi:hypothetical protein
LMNQLLKMVKDIYKNVQSSLEGVPIFNQQFKHIIHQNIAVYLYLRKNNNFLPPQQFS